MTKFLFIFCFLCSIVLAQGNYFLAIDIPTDIEKKLQPIANMLENRLIGQFEPPEKFHITLYFLGTLSPNQLAQTKNQILQMIAEQKKFMVTVQELGFFPNQNSARVVWIGAKSPELYKIHQQCKQQIKPQEQSNFQPHITLAHLSPSPPAFVLEPYRKNIADIGELATFEVQEIVLLYSHQGQYTRILSLPLH